MDILIHETSHHAFVFVLLICFSGFFWCLMSGNKPLTSNCPFPEHCLHIYTCMNEMLIHILYFTSIVGPVFLFHMLVGSGWGFFCLFVF